MSGLWMNNEETREGKYPVLLRRDGSVPEATWFVLLSKDPAAPVAIRAYAAEAERLSFDQQYVDDLRGLADRFEHERKHYGDGDPDAGPHRQDDKHAISFPGRLETYRQQLALDVAQELDLDFIDVLRAMRNRDDVGRCRKRGLLDSTISGDPANKP